MVQIKIKGNEIINSFRDSVQSCACICRYYYDPEGNHLLLYPQYQHNRYLRLFCQDHEIRIWTSYSLRHPAYVRPVNVFSIFPCCWILTGFIQINDSLLEFLHLHFHLRHDPDEEVNQTRDGRGKPCLDRS